MNLVSENIDMSKRVLEIDIESPIFKIMLHDLNCEIKRVIKKVFDEEFEDGEITLKLSLTIPEDFKVYPGVNEFNEPINETYRYKRPHFEHKVSTTLKKQYKQEGLYMEEKEVKFEDGQYFVVPIFDPQVSLFDGFKEE